MVSEARPTGTTALLEDIVVPVPRLLPTCERLTTLFDRYDYENAVIFGHAKDGNIHFMLTQRLDDAGASLDRFARFTDDMVELVLGQGGSLKAEHGTGRMMAPFVRRQYGDELYSVMREIKQLCDPRGVLNPGVVIADDPTGHLQDLKSAPPVEEEVDRCVECGFCEPVCPSRQLTTTPRQRIVLRREITRAEHAGEHDLAAELEREYTYDAVETCATDGMCQTACPVHINTGDLVRTLRSRTAGRPSRTAWTVAARHWDRVTRTASIALNITAALPDPLVGSANRAVRRAAGHETVPLWSPDLPRGGRPHTPPASVGAAAAVLFASCTGAMFGPASTATSGATAALLTLCARSDVALGPLPEPAAACCGTPWKSKGMSDGYAEMAQRVLPALWAATGHGSVPIVVDASSCTEGLTLMIESGPPEYRTLQVVDAVEFCATRLLPHLTATRPFREIALHPTCSATRLGITPALQELAQFVSASVVVPDSWGCCAFAGDRGMLHPELTAAATREQAAELAGHDADAHASCNRTCELGMTRATGQDYVHILELVERATRPLGG
jgi:D-lactate dehydrogenase